MNVKSGGSTQICLRVEAWRSSDGRWPEQWDKECGKKAEITNPSSFKYTPLKV